MKIFCILMSWVVASILSSCASGRLSESGPSIVEKGGAKLYEFNVGNSRFLMNPINGARLMSWDISQRGEDRSVIYWPKDGPFGGNLEKVMGGAPILFPFSGSSFVDGKEGIWKAPSGKIYPMKKHGFANGGKFEIVSCNSDSILLKFVPDDYSKKAYPFDYEFYVSYKFGSNSYIVEMTLVNNGDENLPWGVGYHPYFAMPWNSGETHADYRLSIDCDGAEYVKSDGTFAKAEDFRKYMTFDSPKLASRIHTSLRSGTVKFGPKSGLEDIEIVVNGGLKPPNSATIVTWGRPMESPFWCVEPWIVPPASASKALQSVAPHSRGVFKVEVKL